MSLRASKRLAVPQGISFEKGLLPRAKKRAKQRRRNLSAHICDLIIADIEKSEADSAANPKKQEAK